MHMGLVTHITGGYYFAQDVHLNIGRLLVEE